LVLPLQQQPISRNHDNPCQRRQGPIEEDAFTQRLRTIYRKFKISGRGYKLPQLQRFLAQQYLQSGPGLSRFGLSRIHAAFPTDIFAAALERLIHDQEQAQPKDYKEMAIMQTFAPNLEHYRSHLSRCLQVGVRLRILLAWPYSQAAGLREEVLKRYAAEPMAEDFAIQGSVIGNPAVRHPAFPFPVPRWPHVVGGALPAWGPGDPHLPAGARPARQRCPAHRHFVKRLRADVDRGASVPARSRSELAQ
jgi:hypothetical protein